MKAFLVEDNIAEATLTKYVYKSQAAHTELIHCESGEEFLKKIGQTPLSEVAYILLDLNMPRISGLDVLKEVNKEEALRKIPIIILSSSASDNDISACYDLGANAYVTKPVLLEEFGQLISAIDAFWGQLNKRPVLKTNSSRD